MKKIFILIAFSLSCLGCKKFLEIPGPREELLSSVIFSDNATANAAMTAVYIQMGNATGTGSVGSYKLSRYTGFMADELTYYGTSSDVIGEFYRNGLSSVNSNVQSIWQEGYNYIYQANNLIENLAKTDAVSAPVKKQLTGEAKFIRAYWHFYLVNLFGEIPIVTSTAYEDNNRKTRRPVEEVYQQIVVDLKEAQGLLNDNFVGADGLTISAERVRPNKWAATAMLARTYLYIKNYSDAEKEASSVINNSALFGLVRDLDKTFLMNSKEALWQLQIQGTSLTRNTLEGFNFIFAAGPGTSGTTISNDLYNAFENADLRRAKWIKTNTVGTTKYYYPYKYKAGSGSSTITEYVMTLRLSEQYLIRAEARAQQGKFSLAAEDVDSIRVKAGGPKTLAIDQASLLEEIEKERRLELFSEWGHRWFDLKRTDRTSAVMPAATAIKGGVWVENSKMMPIPVKEISSNSLLTQNNGYN